MKSVFTALFVVVGLSSAVVAQTTTTPPGPSIDASADMRFKAADKNNNGSLDGAELTEFNSVMAQVDKNKDGRISRSEFMDGFKAGYIK